MSWIGHIAASPRGRRVLTLRREVPMPRDDLPPSPVIPPGAVISARVLEHSPPPDPDSPPPDPEFGHIISAFVLAIVPPSPVQPPPEPDLLGVAPGDTSLA